MGLLNKKFSDPGGEDGCCRDEFVIGFAVMNFAFCYMYDSYVPLYFRANVKGSSLAAYCFSFCLASSFVLLTDIVLLI